jgi:hypothetical protein
MTASNTVASGRSIRLGKEDDIGVLNGAGFWDAIDEPGIADLRIR